MLQGSFETPGWANVLRRTAVSPAWLAGGPRFGYRAAQVRQLVRRHLTKHRRYIVARGEALPEIRNWRWSQGRGATREVRRSVR